MSIYNKWFFVIAAVLSSPLGARGENCHDHTSMGSPSLGGGAHAATTAAPAPASATQGTPTRGIITAINTQNKKITLRHEDIKDLNMPAMTMNFALGSGVSMEGLALKDTVLFNVQNEKGVLTITHIEKIPGGKP